MENEQREFAKRMLADVDVTLVPEGWLNTILRLIMDETDEQYTGYIFYENYEELLHDMAVNYFDISDMDFFTNGNGIYLLRY